MVLRLLRICSLSERSDLHARAFAFNEIALSHSRKRNSEMIVVSEKIVEMNVANWKGEVTESKELVVVEFWHPECPYCKMLEPVYAELSKTYAGKLRFGRLNVMESEENQDLAAKHGVMSTPTLKFFCGGRPVQDIVGMLPKDYLQQAIDFAIKKHRECAERSTPLSLPYIS